MATPAAMMAPILAPPTKIDRHPGFAQRADDAQVRKTARAAARQHQSHSAAHQQARDPAEIRRLDNVMVQRDG